ncbi:putative ATP-grasp superfamily ATP-dependent carboligase [Diaminobutyricimonas aerilata]|uniref:Putative ATP-grasp superfamily ATP-dependent carboligase n=1 Tax=Diaminobutyricimonas aerilata TaxID=1162967 RepID=A0A2M9CJU5_9MICO|nr:PAC2 family protein [Diaminobutyricimonas aerilata]PJJ72166.1 putative ATP-grasp superfamily ATP-dependent carboligase [Diaminobutyricimonas aerilata]
MADTFAQGRLLVVAFEGWNDAGEAASGAVRVLRDHFEVEPIAEVEPEDYFDYQFNRPTVAIDDDGERVLIWPSVTVFAPVDPTARIHLLLGTEPSRGWKTFAQEILDIVVDREIDGIVLLGAMLADVPHTRPISVFASSDDPAVRAEFGFERSTYEGPVGILSVLGDAARQREIPSLSIWASVPHYVHNAPSPKATLALIERLESILGVDIPRGDLVEEAAAWESGIDALASDDDDMSSYIEQLEQARDTVDSPEASGDAIAEEFERYLRRRDGRDGRSPGQAGDEPWRPDPPVV